MINVIFRKEDFGGFNPARIMFCLKKEKQVTQQPFHLVDPSPWSLCTSLNKKKATSGLIGVLEPLSSSTPCLPEVQRIAPFIESPL
jgi:hypothetical protein